LLAEGMPVVVFDAQPTANVLSSLLEDEEQARVQLVRGRVTDLAHLLNTCREHRVSRIVHLASPLTADCNANPSVAVQEMCQGFVNVLELSRLGQVHRIVWASSISVYGPPEEYAGPLDENSPRHPPALYGSGKVFCEDLARHYRATWGVDSIGLRLPVVYGPGNTRPLSAWTTALFENAALGEPAVAMWADDTLNLIHVEDVAELVFKALTGPSTVRHVFTISGDYLPVVEMVACVRRLIPDAQIEVQPGSAKLPWLFDTTCVEQELGFRPRFTVKSGMLHTMNAARARAGMPALKGAN
jgi:nucleoside-diphosphate-sugar epimerase